jgi:imidazolonepropionase-like amidohydrolase
MALRHGVNDRRSRCATKRTREGVRAGDSAWRDRLTDEIVWRVAVLALRAARLFDGVRLSVVEQPLVLIEDGRITAVDAGAVQPPRAAALIDLGDATLLPGLIDVHVHLGFDAGPDPVARMKADDDATLLLRMAFHARRALSAGITTVRDLGDRGYLAVALREWFRDGKEIGPHILTAGPPVTVTGGHCYFMGGEADGELEVRRGVRARVKAGVDVIKVMATGGNMTPGTNVLEPQYTVPELAAAVEEAHRLGRAVTAHAHGAAGIARAVAAGVDGIEHCTFQTADGIHADQDVIERIAARQIAVCPTIGRPPGSPAPGQSAARRTARLRVLERMHRAGVRLVGGTDAGIRGVPHDSLPYGVMALAEAGLSHAEALCAATAGSAAACGLAERTGALLPGRDADILAVGGNPLNDLGALLDVRAVFRGGVRVR